MSALKCPYCGTENKIGEAWQKTENEARDDMLRTKKDIVRSMPLYITDKVVNIILIAAVIGVILFFVVAVMVFWIGDKFTVRKQSLASVEYAEELYETGTAEELYNYLDKYELQSVDTYDKYTEYVYLCNQWDDFLQNVLYVQEKFDWGTDHNISTFYVRILLDDARDVLTENDWAYRDLEYEENLEYLETLKEDAAAILMGTLEMTPEEITELTKSDDDGMEPLVKQICERKGWEYEEE